ncbi:hypothetical protein CHS0354_029872 [Potamilus streckersoni]|uniref:Uncharacterized protein n=1 Tax=Potamilus streckersoni TaxID=2493646 RepID=A0AAE0TG72_9BIVA|nr:hypothetical protein CHS0354_029872 [Potamilus streckersoni]
MSLVGMVQEASENVIIRAIQELKNTSDWTHSTLEASQALILAFIYERNDICQLMITEGITLDMSDIPEIVHKVQEDVVLKVIKHLKNISQWEEGDLWCSEAFILACESMRYSTCNLLIQEGVILDMFVFCEIIEKAPETVIVNLLQHLKDTNKWISQSDEASKALQLAFINEKNNICESLIKEGIELHQRHITSIIRTASEGVKVELSCLPDIVKNASTSTITKIAEHLKNRNKLYSASEILKWAFIFDRVDICNQLLQVGIVIKMCQFPTVAEKAPLNVIMKVIEYLKGTGRWNPHLQTAFDALRQSFAYEKNKICNLLIQKGIVLKMNDFYKVLREAPIKPVLKVVQHLKENMRWRTDVLALDALNLFKDHRGLGISHMLQREGIQSQAWHHKYKRKIPKASRMMENILFLTNVKLVNCQHLDQGEAYEINQQMHGGFTQTEKDVLFIIANHCIVKLKENSMKV